MKIQKAVVLQTRNIALGELVGCALMCLIFALCGRFTYKVVLGAVWAGAFAVLNFFLLGLTVQKAASEEQARAKRMVQTSYTLRSLLLVLVGVLGLVLPCFQKLAAVLPLFFPQLTIFIMHALGLYRT